MMPAVLGIPGDYLLFTASGLVGMVGGGLVIWGIHKGLGKKIADTKVLAKITLGAAVGYLVGSGVAWWVYEMWR